MADKAFITAEVLKWARESARISEETAASKAGVPIEKLRAWEKGEDFPTIRQAQVLANAYRRPFALLFLPEVPHDFQPLQDFRRPGSQALGTSSLFIIREIQQKQAWMSELKKENNEKEIPFVGKFNMEAKPQAVAQDLLSTLGIDPRRYKANPMLDWFEKAESKGIFISRTSFIHSKLKLDANELQGFAIADRHAPFIFINSDDWNAPQLFTLAHELAHLWIAKSGVSNHVEPSFDEKAFHDPVEKFCNEVAANALMPREHMEGLGPSAFEDAEKVFRAARALGVSSFALLVRALGLGILSPAKYKDLKRLADLEYEAFLERQHDKNEKRKEKEKKGGPNYFLLQLNRNGRLFTQTVLDAFRGGALEPTLASNLLNVQSNKFPKLEAQIYK